MPLESLVICVVLSVGFAEQLPSFIKKCSITDPDVSKCVTTNGNLAISALVKGSSFFGIPPATPLHISAMNLPGADFTVSLSNVRLFGLENIRMKDSSFDPSTSSGRTSLTAPYLNLTANYIIVSNDLSLPRILEGGRLHTTLAENIFLYTGRANRLLRNSEVYFKVADDDILFQSKRIFYRYSELRVSSTGNLLEFLNVHKRIIDERIRPAVSAIMHKLITVTLVNLVNKLPVEGYFDV